MFHVEPAEPLPDAATALFGERVPLAVRYADLLRGTGTTHGLIGPREGERLWERHLINCAVLAELIEPGARVLDVGSGAGLPGIPLAIARPDLEIALLEAMARRVTWLRETLDDLGLPVTVTRGRAEEPDVRREWYGADVVTARAVAPLAKLGRWTLPLLRPGGRLLAMKGESAHEEARRAEIELRRFGGSPPRVVQCGKAHVDPPTTVVVVGRSAPGTVRRRTRAGDAAGGHNPRQQQETGGGRSDDVRRTGFRRGQRG